MLQTRDRQGFSAMTFTVRISPMSLVWFPVPTYLLPLAWTSQTSFEYISNIFKQHIPLVRSKLQEYKHHIEQKTEKRCLLWSHNSHDVIQLRSYAQEFFKVPLIQPDKKTQPMRGPACHSCFQASPKTTIHSMHATSKFKKYENYSASNWATFELVSPFSDDRGIFFFHNNLWRSVVLKVASQLCGTIQSLKRNHPMNHILESATGSDCAPGVLVERDRGKSQKTSRKGTNLDVSQQSPGTFFHLTNFFLASFSAWRPYKSDNKLQRPLKLHQHISGMEPNLFQPLQKPRPSTRPHHGPLAGQIHDVQPPQGWQSKFLRPIAEWTNPLNIYLLRCDDSRFWSCTNWFGEN